MEKKLIKFHLHVGFECKPELNAIQYEDIVLEGGRVYQNHKGVKDDKSLIRLNETWMNYEDNCNEPYWDSFVIVEQGIEKEYLIDIIKNLYMMNKMIMQNSKESFIYRLKEMSIPVDDDIVHSIRNVLNYNSNPDTFKIKISDFKDELFVKAKSIGDELVQVNKKNMNDWNEFFEQQIKTSFVDDLLKRFAILKFDDTYVEFQIRHVYKQTINNIANKLANDLYYMFAK